MQKINLIIPSFLTLLFACNPAGEKEAEIEITPKTNVQITTVRNGSVSDLLELFASTVYLKRNVVTAPIPAFITRVNISLGQHVNKGDVLYVLESKEHRALGNEMNAIDSSLTNFGVIAVKATASGVITTLDKQLTGDYVMEGTQLCTIAESNDLSFQVNVPYEFTEFVRKGKKCSIVLPDNSVHTATISTPLTTMNLTAQTQTILAKADESLILPENLIVRVLIGKDEDSSKQVLPKSCLQSDEMMKEFWVMKLINDSTAIKVSVVTGNKNENDVEILTPTFAGDDRIILTGSYGLPDTALVNIINSPEDDR